jgi:hypothetical protein
MDTDGLLSQAKEFILLDIEELYQEWNNVKQNYRNEYVRDSLLRNAIIDRKNWIKEYNLNNGVGCIMCGSEEGLGDESEICNECKILSKESIYT